MTGVQTCALPICKGLFPDILRNINVVPVEGPDDINNIIEDFRIRIESLPMFCPRAMTRSMTKTLDQTRRKIGECAEVIRISELRSEESPFSVDDLQTHKRMLEDEERCLIYTLNLIRVIYPTEIGSAKITHAQVRRFFQQEVNGR